MVDIASLAIQIDTSDIARAEKDLDRLGSSGAKAERAAGNIEGALTGAAKAAGVYRDAAGRLREANGKFVSDARKVELGLKGINGEAKKAAREFNGLSSAATKVGATLAAALSVREVYQATEAYTSISNRLKLVTNSAGEFAAAQAAVFRVAQEGRQPLTETAELYQRIATNQQQLGLTGAGVARVTETISKSLAVSGASAATAAGALTQLGQAFASGALRGEELNSVLEGAPALAQTLARGLNVTVGELRALGAEGKLTAEQVVGAILSQSDAMDEAFGKLAPNISGALTTVGNSFTQLIGKMDETSGASSGTASAIMDVAEILSDPATVEAAQTFGRGIATAIGWIAEASTATVGTVKWMAEELAATLHGAASDDIVRLQDQLETFQAMLDNPLRRLRIGGDGQPLKLFSEEEIQQNISILKKMIDDYGSLAAVQGEVGSSAASAVPKLEALRTGTASLGAAATEAAGKTDKQAVAFQSLIDGLFPAEAAQRQYNEQVALLDKYLDGDQLAKAVDKLNHSLAGVDATGPGDFIEEYRKELERLEDQLDPVGKATEQYQKDVERLNDAMERGERSPERTAELLAELERQYKDNTKATSDWAQWTEGALDRVDSAFADAWRNIGDGFSSFRDSLTDAFKQMLAELAHMAITKPIIMQLGASMGIGSGTQGNNGIWGSLLGGGSASGGGAGGNDVLGTVNQARSLYSMYGTAQSLWPALQGGWAGGGFGGALSAVGSSIGSMFGIGSGAAASSAAGSVASGYTGAAMSQWVAAQTANTAATTGLSTVMAKIGAMASNPVGWVIAAAVSGYQGSKMYKQGVRADAGEVLGQTDSKLGKALMIQPAFDSKIHEWMDSAFRDIGVGDKALSWLGAGGAIHQSLWGADGVVSKALFGGSWKTKDYGLGFSVEDGAFDAERYEYRKKKGGLFSSSKTKTIRSDIDPEALAALQETYDATQAGVSSLFESLSLSIEDGALDGLQLAREKISTKGKTEEEISQAIADWFGKAAEAMNTELNKVFATGLDYDLAGMQAFVANLQGVNALFDQLNLSLYESTVAGGKMAEQLSALAGGLEALAASTATYYDAFYSAEEKTADTLAAITKAFESADVELVGSREKYRTMVDNIDRTTEAGQQMFAVLVALAGQASTYYSVLEQQLMGGVNNAYASLQRSIANQQREIQQQASSTTSSINALTGISNSLDAALKKLRGTSDDTVRSLRAQAVMTLNSALVQARSGQSLAGFEGLQDALDTASQMDTALYGSLEDFEREQGRTANLIAELEKVNGKQLTTEQQVLKELDQQSSALNAQLEYAQSQLDALNGIDTSVLTVADAIAALNTSVVSALQALQPGAAKGNTPANNGVIVDSIYKDLFGREADQAGRDYWTGQLGSGAIDYSGAVGAIGSGAQGSDLAALIGGAYQDALGRDADAGGAAYWEQQISAGNLSYVDLQDALKAAAKAAGEVPAFAAGGFHSGGLRLVGENGPELEVTGPSRIYNASQTAAMLGGGDSTAAITSLQRTVEGQSAALRSIAKHTMQTAKRVEFLERWDFDGLPKERATA